MIKMMAEDFEPPTRGTRAGGDSGSDLINVTAIARQYPGRWFQLGEPRKLDKPPSSWCSEIRRGEKKCFRPGERWEPAYEQDGDLYIKFIRLLDAAE